MGASKNQTKTGPGSTYKLDEQVGFIFRRATQRHLGIFASQIPELTPTQFAAIAKLHELGPVSQNELGRRTAMDAATIKGVIDRLRKRDLVTTRRDEDDQRRIFVELNQAGRDMFANSVAAAHRITAKTLAPLSPGEQDSFLKLLKKII
ncbi:Transcriptional regulator, MarR family [hydrothermal vent metagenome]|uniref:Transcriptional regulator, MarR family n=1 Tax=hydrothermal vent metagenome TaxID=652676 RepID=A0A3B0U1K0_9ZZZZ